MDSHGRLAWGLVRVQDATVYWEKTEAGLRAKEFGVAGPWHPVSESVNRLVWEAVQADIQKHGN